MTAPENSLVFFEGAPTSEVITAVYDHYTETKLTALDTIPFVVNGLGAYQATAFLSGTPGSHVDPDTAIKILDSIDVTTRQMQNGDAHGWRIIPGRIDGRFPSITGPTGLLPSTSTTWHAQTPWDSTAYLYKWILDGSEVSGATDASYSTSLSEGTHSLAAVVIRADNTRDSVVASLEAYGLSISGPSSVQPFADCEWSASTSGGSSPFSYAWEAAGGSSTSAFFDYENGSNDGESFTMTLTATDNLGFPVTVTKTVRVSNAAPTCAF